MPDPIIISRGLGGNWAQRITGIAAAKTTDADVDKIAREVEEFARNMNQLHEIVRLVDVSNYLNTGCINCG
jgi:hypothetical protein